MQSEELKKKLWENGNIEIKSVLWHVHFREITHGFWYLRDLWNPVLSRGEDTLVSSLSFLKSGSNVYSCDTAQGLTWKDQSINRCDLPGYMLESLWEQGSSYKITVLELHSRPVNSKVLREAKHKHQILLKSLVNSSMQRSLRTIILWRPLLCEDTRVINPMIYNFFDNSFFFLYD